MTESLFNKVAGLSPATLFKKRVWLRCFLANIAKFLTTPLLQTTFRRLLLEIFRNIEITNDGRNDKLSKHSLS